MLAYYLLVKFKEIVDGLEVFPERMIENLERSYGLVFSQPVLLALVASGLDRDAAYRVVQASAMAAWEERRPFADILRENPDVTGRLSEERLAACFDLKAALANSGRVFDVLDSPEPHTFD
jgi:adenylosuccinate lyase